MPQDDPDAVSPLAPFQGSYAIPGFPLTRRWFPARDLSPELSAQVLDLIRAAFNDQASWFALSVPPQDHLDWKYRDRPTGVTAHLVVEQDGQVVGFTGGVLRIWLVNGKRYVGRAGYDLSLHPRWQGKGLQRAQQPFRHLEQHPSEEIGVGYVTHPADRHISVQQGNWIPANETHDYVRAFNPLPRLVAALKRALPSSHSSQDSQRSSTTGVIRQRESRPIEHLRRIARFSMRYALSLVARRPAPPPGDWTISTLTSFQEHHQPFIAEAVSQFDFIAERSLAYLNWRYCDPRGGPFTVRLAHRDGHYLGYAVTRIRDGDAGLADILVLPGHLEVAESLIRDAIDLARNAGAHAISTRLPERHPYRPALARAGFFDIGPVAGELLDPRQTPEAELALLDHKDTLVHPVLADADYV